jgi:acid phosphatase family membrane protein YuiD
MHVSFINPALCPFDFVRQKGSMELFDNLFFNTPFTAALLAILAAQFIKIPLHYVATREWQWGMLFSTGSMPSSHSAGVTALATAVGLKEGFDSSLFAISAVIGLIVMHDAAGVRRHAGLQAAVVNKLVDEFNHMLSGSKALTVKPRHEKEKKLKELLGHQPIEVFMGGWLGIVVALLYHTYWG